MLKYSFILRSESRIFYSLAKPFTDHKRAACNSIGLVTLKAQRSVLGSLHVHQEVAKN